ncbi:DeoR/GlpR family DNA-binding transcription regulator [Lacticaseibacillus pantheris]
MIPYQRQEQILKLVNNQKFCRYSDIASQLFVSQATIRRDTRDMERMGLVRRVTGGITLIRDPEDVPYDYSATLNLKEKRQLAQKAATVVSPGMCLFVDSSTTTLVFIRELMSIDNLYIVTNGFVPAIECSKNSSWHVSLLGGRVNSVLQNVGGNKAITDIANYQADLAVFSCRGLTDKGATDANDLESGIKHAFSANADQSMLLVDSTKVGKHQLYISAPMHDLDYIACDVTLPTPIQSAADQHSVQILD